MEEGPCFEDNSKPWFTDGSRKYGKVSLGVRGQDLGLTEPLCAYSAVLQSEVNAIELCTRDILSMKLRVFLTVRLF